MVVGLRSKHIINFETQGRVLLTPGEPGCGSFRACPENQS